MEPPPFLPRLMQCILVVGDAFAHWVATGYSQQTPPRATRFRGNRFAVSGFAGDGGRGPGGAHTSSGQRCRPLLAMYRDALGGAGYDCCRCSGPGQNRHPRASRRGARGRPVLAAQALHSTPSRQLLRHFPDHPYSLITGCALHILRAQLRRRFAGWLPIWKAAPMHKGCRGKESRCQSFA